jgi:hypothetical protein
MEDQPIPPAGSKCKIVNTGLKMANKTVSCVFHKKQTMTKFKCPKYNVGLCVDEDRIQMLKLKYKIVF